MDRRVIKRTVRKRTYGAEWIHCSVGGFSECGDEPIGFMNAGNFLTGWRTIHNSRKIPYCTLHFLDFTNRYRSLPSSDQRLRAQRMGVSYSMWFWCFDHRLSSGIESTYAVRLFLLMCSWGILPLRHGPSSASAQTGRTSLRLAVNSILNTESL